MLSLNGIKENLSSLLKVPIVFFEDVPSTNAIAKQLANQGAPEGTAVFARRQSAGRGRLGRSFASPDGGIYLSMVARPSLSPEDSLCLTMAASVGIRRAVKRVTGQELSIKWVNDLYLESFKVCGILAEGSASSQGRLDYCIIGAGLNYTTSAFPPELENIAGSLFPTGSAPASINRMAGIMAEELYKAISNPTAKDIYEEYRAHSMVLGKRVKLIQMDALGKVLDILPNGSLLVDVDNQGERVINSGEVSIRVE